MFSRNPGSIMEPLPGRLSIHHALMSGAVAAVVAFLPTISFGQSARPLVRPLDQIDRRIEERRQQQRIEVPPLSGIDQRDTPPTSGASFQLRRISAEGTHAIPAELIEAETQKYSGRAVSVEDLAALTDAITGLYRARGYHLSRAIIPVQDIRNGVLRVRIIEGLIAEIAIKGEAVEKFGIRGRLNPILAESPSNLATVERQLFLASALPGVRIVDTALEEIGPMSGRFRLIVTAETWAAQVAYGIDNLGSPAVGKWQTYATVSANSSLVAGDTLSAIVTTVPEDFRELASGRVSYDAPIGHNGVLLGISATHNVTKPGDERRQFRTTTRSDILESRVTFVPHQSATSSLWLTAAVGAEHSTEGDDIGPLYSDHTRTVTLKGDFSFRDVMGAWNYLTAYGRFGTVLGSPNDGNAWLSRDRASEDFSLLGYTLTRHHRFNDVWSVRASLNGQLTNSRLLTSQQFQLGGPGFGPGYFSGDEGLAGVAELRFDQPLPSQVLKSFQLYAFAEGGKVWDSDMSWSAAASLASVGGGIRFNFVRDTVLNVGIGVPVHVSSGLELPGLTVLLSFSSSLKFCGASWTMCWTP